MADRATLTCDEFVDLAAAVALDAADGEDARRVEEHARRCRRCRAWLDEFRGTVGALGAAVPQVDPPAHLRVQILEAARKEPRPMPFAPRLARRARASLAWLVAAASLIVAIGALAWVAILQAQIGRLENSIQVANDRAARFDRVVDVLASAQLSVKPLQPAAAGPTSSSGYVFLDPNSETGMLMCHDLPPVEQGHAYQVWFVSGNNRVSAGMLWPDRSGDGYTLIHVPQNLQSFDSIGLTDEPGPTGSPWPTTARVIWAPLR